MPKGQGNKIAFVAPLELPYVPVHAKVPDTAGLHPVTVDFEIKRGVWIEGNVTDQVTGKPVKAAVDYFSLYSNPNLHEYPGFNGTMRVPIWTKADGSYRIVGLPDLASSPSNTRTKPEQSSVPGGSRTGR